MGIERLRSYGGATYYANSDSNLNNASYAEQVEKARNQGDPLRNIADGAGPEETHCIHPMNMNEDGSPRIGIKSTSYGSVADEYHGSPGFQMDTETQHLHGVDERKVQVKVKGWLPDMSKRRNRQIAFRLTLCLIAMFLMGLLMYLIFPAHTRALLHMKPAPTLGAPRSMTLPIGTVMPVTTEAAMDVPAETVTPEKIETVTEIPTTADPEVIQNVESRRMDIDGAPIDGMYHYDEAADHAMAASANEDHFNSTDV